MKLLRQVEGLNKIVNIVLKVSKASRVHAWYPLVPCFWVWVAVYSCCCLLLL